MPFLHARTASPLALAALATALVALLPACSSRARAGGGDIAAGEGRAGRAARARPLDPIPLYAGAGLIAQADPIRFVGSTRFLAGATPDSTLLLLALSIPNTALTFVSDAAADAQRARYLVAVELRRGGAPVRRVETRQSVRVSSFRETSRSDESVVFQQFLPLAPGEYDLAVSVRDEGSGRTGGETVRVTVPRLAAGTLATPIPVYEATPRLTTDSFPAIVANPRGTAFFGRDSLLRVYLEGYGVAEGGAATVEVRGDRDAVLWRDTLPLGGRADAVRAGTIPIPVAALGVGRMTLAARLGAAESRVPLFVTLGDEWGITSLDEMLNYLRWFATPGRLAALRDADPQQRLGRWRAFLAETDPDPRTPEHEALRDYFSRIQFANERFTEEGTPGWLTERGEVYVTLGDPDQVLEQGESAMNQRGRMQAWVYSRHRVQLVFVDQTGFGRWRLTPSSQNEFNVVAMRERK